MATTTTTPPTQASNAEVIRWSFDRLNANDVDSLKQVWGPETVERFPDRTCRGSEELAAYFEEALAAIPDWRIEITSLVEHGDDVFVHWHLTGTHEGTLLGIEGTGKPLAIDGMDHFVVRDGKVVSNFVVFDQIQYARQIGMMPPDGSAADKAMKAAFNARTKLMQKLRN